MSETLAKWTVMVYMNADNDLEEQALADFREMARVEITELVNVVVQFDRKGVTGDPRWGETLRFLVKNGMEPTRENAEVKDLGELNMGDRRVLKEFVEWTMEHHEAERYALVIWAHGQGWRLSDMVKLDAEDEGFREYVDYRRALWDRETERRHALLDRVELDALQDIETDADGRPLNPIPWDSAVHGTVWFVYSDDTSHGDRLYNGEIQSALESLRGGKTLDLIVFNSCLMAMVEVAYAVRHVAQVMVASEEVMPDTGLDHTDWLRTLTAKPEMEAHELGRTLVDSYWETNRLTRPDATISAVNLPMMDGLADAIDVLADVLRTDLQHHLAGIKNARAKCSPYGPGAAKNGIDFENFCNELAKSDVDPAVKNAARTAGAKAKALVIRHRAGPLRDEGYGSLGLAIYFPQTRTIFGNDPDHYAYLPPAGRPQVEWPIEFVDTRRWSLFLADYLSRVH